jgi:hypothetical protein
VVSRLALLALAAAVWVAITAGASSAKKPPSAPAKAVTTATRYVTGRYGLTSISGVGSMRSRCRNAWALVSGFYRKLGTGGTWAGWLRLEDGYWIVKYAGLDAQGLVPPASLRVPCDIRPAFSEPAC